MDRWVFFLLKSSFGILKELNKRCKLTEQSVPSKYIISCGQGLTQDQPICHW